ncbi:hypothetical protein CANINC_003665 [Pichia inconspicua]|uniref:Autophagy-related protein 9 n=1 Tax=Pichia inconspicua TaxID=52247 RepID=A0A4T0WY51_9ASCO|nr:hypothetical protein CANINC_003665 [[Candida] inconspicua]
MEYPNSNTNHTFLSRVLGTVEEENNSTPPFHDDTLGDLQFQNHSLSNQPLSDINFKDNIRDINFQSDNESDDEDTNLREQLEEELNLNFDIEDQRDHSRRNNYTQNNIHRSILNTIEESVHHLKDVAKNYSQTRHHYPPLPPQDRARWLWANVSNLDIFLADLYTYYQGNGWLCIALSRTCDLLVAVFVVLLSAFLGHCVDYNSLFTGSATTLSQVCSSPASCIASTPFTQKLFYIFLFILLALRTANAYNSLNHLRDIKLFYNYLLQIDDSELQTISWPQVVKRIMSVKAQNTNAATSTIKSKLNAHDIANRLMRRENYFIAMINMNILGDALNLSIPPFHLFTKTLEWNLKLCILDSFFDSQGHLKRKIISKNHRLTNITELKKRFRIAGLLGIFISPFLVFYFTAYYFLKLFYDVKTNPGILNARSYSPLARWKMREYNELPHIFHKRLSLSKEHADNYLANFPKEITNILLNFIAFLSGSLLAILVILTLIDHENFLTFEITSGRTTLFYISALGALFTLCKNSVPDNTTRYLFNPESSLRNVAQHTHYLPKSWENRYHTVDVKTQFCALYNLRIYLIFKELCSLIFLPYILYFSLPKMSDRIIDFFRDYSVHVDGIGYVCSFAMFNMNDNKDKLGKEPDKNDKMVASYIHFIESYGDPTTATATATTGHRTFQNPTHNLLRKNTGNNNIPHVEEKNNSIVNVNNSMLLGESFQLGTQNHNNLASSDDIDHSTGGVLGLLNQVYKYK